jgi:hypothetical protein
MILLGAASCYLCMHALYIFWLLKNTSFERWHANMQYNATEQLTTTAESSR